GAVVVAPAAGPAVAAVSPSAGVQAASASRSGAVSRAGFIAVLRERGEQPNAKPGPDRPAARPALPDAARSGLQAVDRRVEGGARPHRRAGLLQARAVV